MGKWRAIFMIGVVGAAGCVSTAPRGAGAAEGYSITLISAEPASGQRLVRGSEVTFNVTAAYRNSVSRKAEVMLVFQDENNANIEPGGSQARAEAPGRKGTVSLQKTLTIPANVHELWVFVPLVPYGAANTSGSVSLHYQVVAAR